MYSSKLLSSDHKDLIHDVAFNWYGSHLATCSSDQTVRVWVWDGDKNTWHCSASWKSHSGAVWKCTWAHPEFGQVLATCSFDRTATIWEEMPGQIQTGSNKQVQPPNNAVSVSVPLNRNENEALSHWAKRASLVDSRTAITDIKFAPKHLGMIIATCSSDGNVRIYEAPDVMNLAQWTLQHEIPIKVSCSCLSWNQSLSKSQAPMLAIGSDDRTIAMSTNFSGASTTTNGNTSGGKVFIYEYSETARRWVRAETLSTITNAVHDIAFAPNLGRSYNVLAVASKDLRLVTLKPSGSASSMTSTFEKGTEVATEAGEGESTKYEVRLAGQFNDHESTVWRVCWNVTGTILASSGDDGNVKLWKANYLDNWKCVATLRGDGAPNDNSGPPGEAYKMPAGMAFASSGDPGGSSAMPSANSGISFGGAEKAQFWN